MSLYGHLLQALHAHGCPQEGFRELSDQKRFLFFVCVASERANKKYKMSKVTLTGSQRENMKLEMSFTFLFLPI